LPGSATTPAAWDLERGLSWAAKPPGRRAAAYAAADQTFL